MKPETIIVHGKNPLRGKVTPQGSKNASLPILAAAALSRNEVVLHNVPDLVDIHAMLSILEYLGATYTFEHGVVRLNCANIESKMIPDSYANRLRASSLLLGPLIGRFATCEVGMPGGCKIGVRPLDIHFKGFEKLGATVDVENGRIRILNANLQGEYTLEFPSVGATENFITSSVYNRGKVVLRNYAKEPEIMDLIHFLQAGGAKISFEDDHSDLVIEGIDDLQPIEYRVQADRIEAGTYLFAALATRGDVTVENMNPKPLSAPLEKLMQMGALVETTENSIRVAYKGDVKGVLVKTAVYPGFPTDLQSQMGVLMTQASTPSRLTEAVFEHRFRYIQELFRLNASITVNGQSAYIEPSVLSGCRVEGHDLRGTASMIIAGLCADGVTHVTGLKHLYRGYEAFIEKLQFLGADIVDL